MNSASRRLIVQKYGGATLSTPEKIKQVANRIAELHQTGVQVVAAVSAMGTSTNDLIALALQISNRPQRRELDMLLTTGERVSMALLSMALHDLGISAISFTGSQAGILTNDAHVNARIVDVRALRVEEALARDQVVVLAGFQGVSPTSKEITTLGRGGTDTTAVAMAAHLRAERCELLKEVDGVLDSDPKILPNCKNITQLSYDQAMEMTFWGAKVLHYRCVELAKQKNVELYVGPAKNQSQSGTTIRRTSMFESDQVLGLSSHENVLSFHASSSHLHTAVADLEKCLHRLQIPSLQFLSIEQIASDNVLIRFTAPSETLRAIQSEKSTLQKAGFSLGGSLLSSVSLTCAGVVSPTVSMKVFSQLEKNAIPIQKAQYSPMNINIFLEEKYRVQALECLHQIISKDC